MSILNLKISLFKLFLLTRLFKSNFKMRTSKEKIPRTYMNRKNLIKWEQMIPLIRLK